MKKLLIIEDEVRAAQNIQKGLKEHHYDSDIALDGESGLAVLLNTDYELVILDAMLPGITGWDILTQLRRHGRQVPVLMLTALNDVNHRLKGFEAGADDYLAKPFAFPELVARIEAILRRTRANLPVESIVVGDLRINPINQSVFRGEVKIELSPKEFQLLYQLAANTGRFVSRKHLTEKVWDIHFDCETNVVDVAIRRLRQKLDENHDVKLIHTVRGVGYVLEAR